MSQPSSILVIEDDPAVGRSLQAGLAHEGYIVIWKTTGADGVLAARTHQPHLIILDVRLPDGSGFDVCHQLRRLGLRQPILMLTVQRDEVDKILGLEMGAGDYLTKPYRLNRFHRGRNASAYPGSGLGLAIVNAIVARHGGQMSVQSTAAGTCFVIRWPYAAPQH